MRTTDELIDAVTEKTQGTAGDPLTRDEVAQVVMATLDVMGLDANGKPAGPTEPLEPAGD